MSKNNSYYKLKQYALLIRLNKPIGVFLLLWPTLWALWIAADGIPPVKLLVIFTLGTFLMRAVGCTINDIADREVDRHVARTAARPLTAGNISLKEARWIFIVLSVLAFILVCFLGVPTMLLSFVAIGLTMVYPFMKRFTYLPQLVLGLAFAWAVPMVFMSAQQQLPAICWLVFLIAAIWPVMYDTYYAMVDREDDLRIGVKSIAILFADFDRLAIALLQVLLLNLWVLLGIVIQAHSFYYVSLLVVVGLFGYQQWITVARDREACFKAFLNNNWVGMVVWLGLVGSYLQG